MSQAGWLRLMYLAGPIGSTAGEGKTWREQAAKALLGEFGIGSYSPAGAFTVENSGGVYDSVSHAVLSINRHAVHRCDALLAVLPEGKASFGSVREIQMARERRRPVVVVTKGHRGHFACDVEVVADMAEAMQTIRAWAMTSLRSVIERYEIREKL